MLTMTHHTRDGRRFCFAGDYTLRETVTGTVHALRDIDGDEVVVQHFANWESAVAWAGGKA